MSRNRPGTEQASRTGSWRRGRFALRGLGLLGLALSLALGAGCRKASTSTVSVPTPALETTPAVVQPPTPPTGGGTGPSAGAGLALLPGTAGGPPAVPPLGGASSLREENRLVVPVQTPPKAAGPPLGGGAVENVHTVPPAPKTGGEKTNPPEGGPPKPPEPLEPWSGSPSLTTSGSRPTDPTVNKIGGKTLAEWKSQLTNEDPSMRTQAIVAVTGFGDLPSDVVALLIDRTRDSDVGPRVQAVLALRVAGVPDSDVPKVVQALADRIEAPAPSLRAPRDPKARVEAQVSVRYEAAITLQRYIEDAAPATSALLDGTRDPGSYAVRLVCLQNLWRVAAQNRKSGPEDRVVQAVLERLQNPKEAHAVKLEAVMALGAMGPPANPVMLTKVVAALNNAARTRSHNYVYGIWAYAALVAMDDKSSDASLLAISKFLNHSDLETRATAAQALGALRSRAKSRIHRLLQVVREDKESLPAQAAISALVQIGEPTDAVLDTLVPLMESKDLGRAFSAIAALVELARGSTRVTDVLDRLLERKEKEFEPIRPAIQFALEQHKKPKPRK